MSGCDRLTRPHPAAEAGADRVPGNGMPWAQKNEAELATAVDGRCSGPCLAGECRGGTWSDPYGCGGCCRCLGGCIVQHERAAAYDYATKRRQP